MHVASIVQFQQMARDVMTPEVNSTHDHMSHRDTDVALQLRKTPSGSDGSSETTIAKIAKAKRK